MRVLLLAVSSLALAQPYVEKGPPAEKPAATGAPAAEAPATAQPAKPVGMPFAEQMAYRSLKVTVTPAAAGLRVGLDVHRGMGRPKMFSERTDAAGVAVFERVPTNPMIQKHIRYTVNVDRGGARFPFELDGVPGEGAEVNLTVPEVTSSLDTVEALHNIDILPDEDALVVRHRIWLYNTGETAVNLGTQPAGGLKLPCPDGAKHPELHDEHDPTAEVRGASIFYTGALLPASHGPKVLSFVYTLPHKTKVYEWSQTLPVPTRGATIAVPKHRLKGLQGPVALTLSTRGGLGSTSSVAEEERAFDVLRTDGAQLAAGEPLMFAVGGIPAPDNTALFIVVAFVLAAIGWVLVGFKPSGEGPRLSRSHLLAERDRLVKALARMRRAVERGKLSEARFEREREAITARLVSLYRAIDRLDARG